MITKHPQYTKNKGFTLIEIIMTILILGLSSLILIPYFGAIVHSPDPLIREKAVSLGQGLMDEILSKKWDHNTANGGGPIRTTESPTGTRGLIATDPAASDISATDPGEPASGVESAVDRRLWNDIDDYESLTGVDNFRDQDNQPFTLNGYSRIITVRYIASNSNPITSSTPVGTTAAATATDSKRIVVEVTAPRNEKFYFVSVACNI